MKRKIRIFSHIAIICLSVCMFAFGVYAASTVSVTTSGTVSFKATDVYARVTRSVTGAKSVVNGVEQDVADIVKEFDTTYTESANPFAMGNNEQLKFIDAETPVVMTFTIENLATDRNIDFSITSTEDSDSKNIVDYYIVSANEYKDGVYNINSKATGVDNTETITITFKVADKNKGAQLDYNYTIAMTCQENVTTAIEESSSLRRYGNTYVLDTSLATSNKQITRNVVTGTTSYCEYLPTINGTTVSSVFHIYGTEGSAITGIASQVDSLDTTRLSFSTSEGKTTVSANSSATFTANYYIPMAINNSGTLSLVSYIDDFMSGSSSITSFNLPVTTLEIVGNSGFYGCSNLTMTSLPRWMTNISGYAFNGCENLALTELPAGVTEIGGNAFASCSKLAITEIPTGVTIIKEGAFSGCGSITSLTIPKTVLEIETSSLFEGTSPSESLTNLTLQEGLVTLHEYSLGGYMTELYLPSTVKNMPLSAFNACWQLQTINYGGTRADWEALVANNSIDIKDFYNITGSTIRLIFADGTTIGLGAEGYVEVD